MYNFEREAEFLKDRCDELVRQLADSERALAICDRSRLDVGEFAAHTEAKLTQEVARQKTRLDELGGENRDLSRMLSRSENVRSGLLVEIREREETQMTLQNVLAEAARTEDKLTQEIVRQKSQLWELATSNAALTGNLATYRARFMADLLSRVKMDAAFWGVDIAEALAL
jgi:septal ring factor EnvC (AmiA/AmiB activator)